MFNERNAGTQLRRSSLTSSDVPSNVRHLSKVCIGRGHHLTENWWPILLIVIVRLNRIPVQEPSLRRVFRRFFLYSVGLIATHFSVSSRDSNALSVAPSRSSCRSTRQREVSPEADPDEVCVLSHKTVNDYLIFCAVSYVTLKV